MGRTTAAAAPAVRWRWTPAATAPAVALVAGLAVAVAGLQGTDYPAQMFRAELFRRNGWLLWNGQWYGGHPTLSYSVLYPPLGAVLGPVVIAVAAGIVATWQFERASVPHFGAAGRVGAVVFALGCTVNVLVGRSTFALGLAFGLGAVAALQRRRRGHGLALAVACPLASPIAGVGLAIAAGGWLLGDRDRRGEALALGVAATVPIAVLAVVFPVTGAHPFERWELVWGLTVCAATALLLPPGERVLRAGVALYGVAYVAAYVIPTPLGGNIGRVGQFVLLPLLACVLWPRRRLVLAAAAVPLVVWQWAPIAGTLTGRGEPARQEAFYDPVIGFLQPRLGPGERVEVPFTKGHWETAYLALALPLARGWERDLDVVGNPTFYDGTLDEAGYQHWLADRAVRYVAVPDVPMDGSSGQEASIIASSPGYLTQVWTTPGWVVYEVTDPPDPVVGSAALVEMDAAHFVLDVTGPGSVLVRVRYSPHWTVHGQGCAEADDEGWTRLVGLERGRVEVTQGWIGTPCP